MARAPAQRSSQVGPSKFIIFDRFQKLNTKVSRQNLADNQAAWMENLEPIAENLLQVVPGPNSPIASISPKLGSRLFYATLSGIDYVVVCTQDGAVILVNISNGAKTTIAPAGTFSAIPDMTEYSSSVLLFMDATGGYVGWNGTLLAQKGTLSFNINLTNGGSGYTSPTVVFSGGHGSSAAATATTVGGVITSLTMTNLGTGYQAGDVVTISFTGGGSLATATIVIWPQVTGTTICVAFGRIWWANGRILNFTGTGAGTGQTYDDIAPNDAAGSTTVTDYDLAHSIQAIRFLNNFLYIFGDQAIKQIGSITVQSSVTLFTILTLASDIGCSFMMTILSYNRLVLFANKNGVYGIFGSTVQKISDDLDGVFQLINFTAFQMSAGLNDFEVSLPNTGGGSQHCYVLIAQYLDPQVGARSLMMAYQTNKWFLASEGVAPSAVVGVPSAATTQFELFVSDGTNITQLFQNVNVGVNIKLITALSAHENVLMAKQVIRSGIAMTSATAQSVTVTVDTENDSNTYTFMASELVAWINNAGQTVQWVNNSSQAVNFQTGGFVFPYQSTEGYGRFIGNTVTGTGMINMSINTIANEYQDADLWGASP